MKIKLLALIAAVVGGIALMPLLAEDEPAQETQAVYKALQDKIPGLKPEQIKPSPIPGLYEISRGGLVGYASADGQYLIDGDLLAVHDEGFTNLSEQRRQEWRKQVIAGMDEQDMVVFAPEQPKQMITVFTDIDCGYCRRLHRNIGSLMAQGIKVRYVSFPLGGPGSVSFNKAINVWCADDRQKALTAAKQGKKVESPSCNPPLAEHMQAARKLQINSTPTIIAADGRVINPGVPPAKMGLALAQTE